MRRLLVVMALAAACGGGGDPGDDFEWPPCPEWDHASPKPQCYIDRYERGSWDGHCWQPPDRLFERLTVRVDGEPVCLPKPETIPDAGVRPGAGYFCSIDFSGRGRVAIEERARMFCSQDPRDCPCGPEAVIPEICFAPRFVSDADGTNEQLEWIFVYGEVCPAS